MNILTHLDLLSVGLIVAAIGILGFIVFFNNPKSITNKTFLWFCLLTIAWGSCNYLSYQIRNLDVAFWLLRTSIFIAVWHSLFLFQLLYVFPKEISGLPKSYHRGLLPLVIITALLNLTPFTFNEISAVSADGRIIQVENGPGIILFTTVILALIISAVVIFIKKIRAKKEITQNQAKPILWGIIVTFTCILVFNFIFPAFLNNSKFVSLGAFFMFPFILGVGYSIFRHGFLNVKVISTEILTFLLAVVILLDVINSTDYTSLIIRIAIFILVVTVGILLIKSVMREVQQREQLQILTTKLANANVKLKALDEARAEFISIASHQLRTPPATMKWYVASILAGDFGKLNPELKEGLQKVEQTNNGLIALIEDLLNVSRIERGKMEFLFQPINILEIVRSIYDQLLPHAKEKGVALTFTEPKIKLPPITADKEKLKQVINNLVDNAIKYTPKGFVRMEIASDAKNILIKVYDSGKGVDPAETKNIFQKYSRGKDAHHHSMGLGLGLYVAKIVIEQHKGKIWVESPGEGKGSTFIVSLPIKNKLKETTLLDLTKSN
jgi:signal transduction histidine kinase